MAINQDTHANIHAPDAASVYRTDDVRAKTKAHIIKENANDRNIVAKTNDIANGANQCSFDTHISISTFAHIATNVHIIYMSKSFGLHSNMNIKLLIKSTHLLQR